MLAIALMKGNAPTAAFKITLFVASLLLLLASWY